MVNQSGKKGDRRGKIRRQRIREEAEQSPDAMTGLLVALVRRAGGSLTVTLAELEDMPPGELVMEGLDSAPEKDRCVLRFVPEGHH